MFALGADAQAIADACWETEFADEGDGCVAANFRFDPNPPAGITYRPTCFDNRVESATLVDGAELHGVRCISASTQFGYAHCTQLNFVDATNFCLDLNGDDTGIAAFAGLTDFTIPQTPQEAGRVCGSGCGYDFMPIWVGFGAFPRNHTCCPIEPSTSIACREGIDRFCAWHEKCGERSTWL